MQLPRINCVKLRRLFIFPVCGIFCAGQIGESAQLKVYWTVQQDTVIRRANLDGSEREDVLQSEGGFVQNIAVDPMERKLYWVSPEAQGVQRANYDGTHVESVVTSFGDPTHVAIDHLNRKMYWANIEGDGSIWRSDLNGTGRELVVEVETSSFSALEVDPTHNHVYWSERNRGTIRRASTIGVAQVETIFDEFQLNTGGNLEGLAIDPVHEFLYATDRSSSAILRMGLDGSSPSIWLTDGVSRPRGIVVDLIHERVIWSNQRSGPERPEDTNISSVDFDGMNRQIEFVPNWRAGPNAPGFVEALEIVDVSIPEPCSSVLAALAIIGYFNVRVR